METALYLQSVIVLGCIALALILIFAIWQTVVSIREYLHSRRAMIEFDNFVRGLNLGEVYKDESLREKDKI